MTKTPTPRKTLAARLAESPLSRAVIAGKLGVDRSALWRWARDDRVLKSRYLEPLAVILGCDAADLMGGEG